MLIHGALVLRELPLQFVFQELVSILRKLIEIECHVYEFGITQSSPRT
jgi:hypothetical protein